MEGRVIGNYRVISKIGRGGMGTVYLAEHLLIGHAVAIKTLRKQYSHNSAIVERFFNEAKASAAIRHPGIVAVQDFGYLPDGGAYLVMEYLHGKPLEQCLRGGARVPLSQALEYTRQIADALHAAHAVGIVHRDLKPDNVFLVPDTAVSGGTRIKLLDFGIAKLMHSEHGNRTRTGVIMGTPAYMAPEQCRGLATIDHRADLYALGCMLFQMLCGRQPFVSDAVVDVMGSHMYVPPPAPSQFNDSIPPPVEQLILTLLAKRPDDRPASAVEIKNALNEPRTQATATPLHGEAGITRGSGNVERTSPGADQRTTLGQSVGQLPVSRQTLHVSRRRLMVSLVSGLVTVLLVVAVYTALRRPGESSSGPLPPVSAGQPEIADVSELDADAAPLQSAVTSPVAEAGMPDAGMPDSGVPNAGALDASTRPQNRRGKPPGKAVQPARPLSLTQQQVTEGIAKVSKLIESCGNLYQVGGEVTLELEIIPRGTIKRIDVIATPDGRLAECVSRLLKTRGRFPITHLGLTTRHSFIF